MHPDVCTFVSEVFYDGRLSSDPSCALQCVDGEAGTRFAAVVHAGNRTWSPEEELVVAGLVSRLLSQRWTDAESVVRDMGIADILVVAPYNAQVKRLRAALPDGARIGTVDKFQGQQAAATIYSMATSSASDMPRNLEFLFSRNRLNVAISRARALAIVVCSPALLRTPCRSPEQLRLVNALCRYVELAGRDPADQHPQ
jgi:uncharacterized protein